jgi:hypothetical protein
LAQVIAALAGGILSSFLARNGLGGIFFILPLGIVACCFDRGTAWVACLIAVLSNIVSTVWLGVASFNNLGSGLSLDTGTILGTVLNIAFFTAMAGGFTFITAGIRRPRVAGVWRLLGTALVCTGIMLSVVATQVKGGVNGLIGTEVDAFSSLYAAAGSSIDTGAITKGLSDVVLHGGAVVAYVSLFYVMFRFCRFLGRIVRHYDRDSGLATFRVDSRIIIAAAGALVLCVLGRFGALEIAGIIGWNALSLCALLYASQGWGVALSFCARWLRPRGPAGEFYQGGGLPVILPWAACIFILFSPIVNAIFVALIALLGLADNWLKLRSKLA